MDWRSLLKLVRQRAELWAVRVVLPAVLDADVVSPRQLILALSQVLDPGEIVVGLAAGVAHVSAVAQVEDVVF